MNVIIDVSNLLYRAYWMGIQYNTTDPNVENFQIFSFLRAIKSYADTYKADKIYAAWDKKTVKGVKNIRHEESEDAYKQGRNKEVAEIVHKLGDLLPDILSSLGIINVFPGILEADDVIAYLSKTLHGKKVIISADKDLYQLINSEVSVFTPTKKLLITPENFEAATGFKQSEFVLAKCIKGDASDNIKGIPRVGVKKLRKYLSGELKLTPEEQLIVEKNRKILDLEFCLNHYPDETAHYNQQLMENNAAFDFDTFWQTCERLDFNSVTNSFSKWQETFDRQPKQKNIVDLLNK